MSGQFIKQDYAAGTGGTRIHYSAYGEGNVLACVNAIGANTVFFRYIVRDFHDRFRVATWDYRGHGLSYFPEPLKDLNISAQALDLAAVLDGLQAPGAVLIAHRTGVQVALEFYRRHADRVRGLVLVAGAAGHPLDVMLASPVSRTVFDAMARMASTVPSVVEFATERFLRGSSILDRVVLPRVNERTVRTEDLNGHVDHMCGLDAELLFGMLTAAEKHTAEDILPEIGVPTLLIAGENDRFTPLAQMRTMCAEIPGAEIMAVPGATHAVLLEQPDQVRLRIEKFFRDRFPEQLESWLSPGAKGRAVKPKAAN